MSGRAHQTHRPQMLIFNFGDQVAALDKCSFADGAMEFTHACAPIFANYRSKARPSERFHGVPQIEVGLL